MPPKIIRIALSVDQELLKQFEDKWRNEGYQSRSEAMRMLIRHYLKTE